MEFRKMVMTIPYARQQRDSQKKTHGCQGGRDSYRLWEGHEHTAIFKMDNQQGPTVQHRKFQCCMVAWMRGDRMGENGSMHIYG